MARPCSSCDALQTSPESKVFRSPTASPAILLALQQGKTSEEQSSHSSPAASASLAVVPYLNSVKNILQFGSTGTVARGTAAGEIRSRLKIQWASLNLPTKVGRFQIFQMSLSTRRRAKIIA